LCPASARYFAVHRPARPAHTNLMNKLILKSSLFYLQAFLHILSRGFPQKQKNVIIFFMQTCGYGIFRGQETHSVSSHLRQQWQRWEA
jgi:hypothetical protein